MSVSKRTCTAVGLAVATILFGGIEPASAVIDVVGVDQVELEWAPATGPVLGYYVDTHCHGQVTRRISWGNSTVVRRDTCDTVQIQVAGFGRVNGGMVRTLSELSEPIRFLDAAPVPPVGALVKSR